MKGLVLIEDTQSTQDMIDSCISVVNNLTLDDMKKIKETSYKWSWKKCWFIKEVKESPLLNFLYQDRKAVIRFLTNLLGCIKQNGSVSLSLLSYNEMVKLSKGDIEINSIWLINY